KPEYLLRPLLWHIEIFENVPADRLAGYAGTVVPTEKVAHHARSEERSSTRGHVIAFLRRRDDTSPQRSEADLIGVVPTVGQPVGDTRTADRPETAGCGLDAQCLGH